MPLGTVIVPAFDRKGAALAVRAALPFVEELGAQLSAVHVREPEPTGQMADYFSHSTLMAEFSEKVAQRAEDMRRAISEAAGKVDYAWLQPLGTEEIDYAPACRGADLIVAPCPAACDRSDADSLVEAIMIGSGRPVLLTPANFKTVLPRNFIIGWNGSVEAARAIAIARPLLETARKVTVISVGQVQRSAPDAAEVAAGLMRAGIDAEGKAVDKVGTVRDTLQGVAAEIRADALLLGAYSHSRLRERVLGGVTRGTIREPALPTFLVH